MMDRPTFLAACRRHALEIALGQPDVVERGLDFMAARMSAVQVAAGLGIDGAHMRHILGRKDREPILPPDLCAAINETFGATGELMDEFTAHQQIRLRAELLRLEQEAVWR